MDEFLHFASDAAQGRGVADGLSLPCGSVLELIGDGTESDLIETAFQEIDSLPRARAVFAAYELAYHAGFRTRDVIDKLHLPKPIYGTGHDDPGPDARC